MKKWLFCLQVNVPPSCLLDGVHTQHFFGTGVIVHHSQEMGLVAVDKNTVAISASDVMLSFAAYPIEIPGEVSFCRVGILEFGSHLCHLNYCLFHGRWFFFILSTIMLLWHITPPLWEL